MTDNVTALNADIDAQVKRELHQKIEAFDNLFADYLAAKADSLRWHPDSNNDDANGKRLDRIYDLFWQLVRTEAPQARHIELKFRALFAEEDDLWRPIRAMLESIRSDVLGL